MIMPTYNGGRYLEAVLQSIASQITPVDELVISDDDSEDDTLQIVKNFSKTSSFKVVIQRHEKAGITANYLHALSFATGDIIIVADQDDIWLPKKSRLIVEKFLADPTVSLISHDCRVVNSESEDLGTTLRGGETKSSKLSKSINGLSDEQNLLRFLRGGVPLLAHTLSFRKELTPILLSKPDYVRNWWFEEWVSCIALSFGRLHLLADQLVLYRQHRNQNSGGVASMNMSSYSRIKSIKEDKYKNRIEKMEYCAGVIEDVVMLSARHRTLKSYISFLRTRQSIIMNKSIKGPISLVKCYFLGLYHRYSNGTKSAALDLLNYLR